LQSFMTSIFLGWGVVSPMPNPQLEDHPSWAVCDFLFNIFAATLHIWRPSPPSTAWGRTMPWWQGTHLTWLSPYYIHNKQILNWFFIMLQLMWTLN
jgi:hypothetical protein